MYAQLKTEGTYTPDALLAGPADNTFARKVIIAQGERLDRGAVLGTKPNGEFVLSLSAAADTSKTPSAILADDSIDTTDGPVEAMVYLRGDFNTAQLTFGAGHTADSARDVLRDAGIYLA